MFLVDVALACFFGTEDGAAVFTLVPVLLLLVLETKPALVSGPPSVTPTAFDLVGMSVAVIEVVAYAVGIKVAAATYRHVVQLRSSRARVVRWAC